jgi:hypothetical protein
MSNVTILPKRVSDRNPLRITFVRSNTIKNPSFRFENWWLQEEGFQDLVRGGGGGGGLELYLTLI